LNKHKIKKVDLCSIDVEGHGLKVVQSIDWDLFDIQWLCIEANDEINEIEKHLSPRYKEYRKIFAKGNIVGDIIFKRQL
jgi:hypothetical protein